MSATRFIVLAGDKRSGQTEAENVEINVVAIVTPRSPNAAQGLTADRIFEATSLTHQDREILLPRVLPALATHPPTTKESPWQSRSAPST